MNLRKKLWRLHCLSCVNSMTKNNKNNSINKFKNLQKYFCFLPSSKRLSKLLSERWVRRWTKIKIPFPSQTNYNPEIPIHLTFNFIAGIFYLKGQFHDKLSSWSHGDTIVYRSMPKWGNAKRFLICLILPS